MTLTNVTKIIFHSLSSIAVFAVSLSFIGAMTPSAAHAGAKGVIELYTSQGCSSCPPADKLAAKYAQNPDLVVLTLPVTYWDYLGWKDTYAKKAFTKRQYAYASLRGDRSVYTPQVVVNGYDHAVGSNARQIERLLKSQTLPVGVDIASEGDNIVVEVAERSAGGKASIWIALFQQKGTVAIGRGENRNREITYTNIVKEMRKIGEWSGDRVKMSLSKKDLMKDGANGFAVVVQTQQNGLPATILGASSWLDASS